MFHKLLGIAAAAVCLLPTLVRADAADVTVDFAQDVGRIRRLNGINGGPMIVGRGDLVKKAAAEYAALAVPNARLHDIPLVTPGLKVCDVPHIFPIYNPKADPKDPANYYFEPTDDYIRNLKACGVESITYRLGTSIEWTHPRTYFAKCPKDIDQFAEVCAGIVRHYTTGWANGFDAGKVYWEIWCEPNSNGSGELWDKGKGLETYYPLYVSVAKRIKREFPNALVGGPSSNRYDFEFARTLADVCKAEGAAFDFFSWHQYISSEEPFDDKIAALRKMLDEKGFGKTELHLNEWHWMPACWSDLESFDSLRRWEDRPDGINGVESAAMVLKTLVGLQASAVDMTDYYMAFDYSSWGLYDRMRRLRPTYWPLAWFGALAKDAACRVAASAAEKNVTVIAGVTADGAKTALVSDFRPGSEAPLVVRLDGLPPDASVAVTSLRADGRPVTESVRLQDGRLTLDRAAGSAVYRIETPVKRILSPDGKVGVAFRLSDGAPKIDVTYNEKPLAALDLGLVLDEPFDGGFAIEDFSLGGADTSWKTVWGDRAEVKDIHRDYTVVLRERGPKARVLKVEMRAYPEGFAFRYVLDGRGKATIRDEATRVVFAPGTVAWPIYNTEDTYPAVPVDAANLKPAPKTQYLDEYMLPLTVRLPDGVCASLFEAYVRHYPRAKGEAVGGGTKIRLIGDMEGRTRGTATVELPFEGPWRAIQVGRNAAELIENATLVLNLNPPCAIADTSYIRPGLCLSDLLNCAMNNKDILAAATRERANGIRHFQIDWGWYGTEWTWTPEEIAAYEKGVPDADTRFPLWRANVVADPRRPAKGYVPYRPDGFFDYGTTVDLDVPSLVKDLGKIGVDLALYLHGQVLEQESDLDSLFARYRQWGLAGLKPGFVRYGDAASTDWNRMLVETAARHRLWLDIHDRHVPDGMSRTYPNLLLCEGGGGEEGNHPVRQDVSLPFARCLVGPFDYTPNLFRDDRTHAHSAAMLLVYPGPAAILRGSAVKRAWGPELEFVRRLPMTYDETKVPLAEIGERLVVARRRGTTWYVAGLCGEKGYVGGMMLDFLGRGPKMRATIAWDGDKGGAAVAETKIVTGGSWFPVRMAPSGGFTMILEELTNDVVIYGATPAGIAAAIAARRAGLAGVVVLEPTQRIGGLTTGGLGQTDIGHKNAFGGISRDFYRDVKRWYRDDAHWVWQRREAYRSGGQSESDPREDAMWTFEPSAALAILENWEKREGLDIRRGEQLDRRPGGVARDGDRLVSVRTKSGKVFRARIFIDATYEGDLLAAAGVSYAVGREANDVYAETINGVQTAWPKPGFPKEWSNQIEVKVDPYVVKGDPTSGLLPGIDPEGGNAPDGSGDRRVQAYCFRACLTDVPANRIPFVKPAGYDERNYELLFRAAEAGADLGLVNFAAMPNGKTDTNNRGGVSTDFIGANWDYPEASDEEREKIVRAHLDYQQGLFWTLANHPRIPASVRAFYSRWGTCRDEFRDGFGNGWQRQLYVREARRLVGSYVMTEHDCRQNRKVPRPVALAAYGMDSHNVRRYVRDGLVRNEGDVQEHDFERPFPIDYGALCPKRDECANLLVPVCVSASHIAFGSIRMEPVFFALGQVAGEAAALSIERDCPVQEVPYPDLRARLLDGGQVLEKPSARVEGRKQEGKQT